MNTLQGSFTHVFSRERDRYLDEWSQFLRFKSVSTDPNYQADCLACADWLKAHLEAIGFRSEILQTSGKPVVWAERAGQVGKPRILYYGHYDVQPVDPLDLWRSDPFAPEIRDGRLYARGAQDNKGQTFYYLKALETLIRQGKLNCPVSLLIEGEEESGSRGLTAALSQWKERLKANILMVCDTGGLFPGMPWITMGLRGLIWMEVKLAGLTHDLHSGALGGVVKNPATEMARLLSTLHDAKGKIAVPGYYDQVREPAEADRVLANKVVLPPEAIKAMLGVEPCGGEQEYTFAERRGFRPTIEVNGINSGYSGPGTKTIIPAHASAKITSRLVPNQNPEKCLDLLVDHMKAQAPRGLQLEIVDQGIGGAALALHSDSALVKIATEALSGIGEGPVHFTWEGGSIPVVTELARISGAEPLLIGFGLEEDHIHAPNESFSLRQFELGFLSICAVLDRLSRESVSAP